MSSQLNEIIQDIYDSQGKLTPQLLVDEARPVDSPLHNRFEWDDSIAGEAYRLMQAGTIIRSVHVITKDATPAPRAWARVERGMIPASDLQDETGEDPVIVAAREGYVPVEVVRDNAVLLEGFRNQMLRDIATLKRRYEQYEFFWATIQQELGGPPDEDLGEAV